MMAARQSVATQGGQCAAESECGAVRKRVSIESGSPVSAVTAFGPSAGCSEGGRDLQERRRKGNRESFHAGQIITRFGSSNLRLDHRH